MMNLSIPKSKLSLKVWWIPQVPMKSFDVEVSSFYAAYVLVRSLAEYDLFQLKNRIKPDYANVGGITIKEALEGNVKEYYDLENSLFWDKAVEILKVDYSTNLSDLTVEQVLKLDEYWEKEFQYNLGV